jgi:hypothetical protein
VMASVAAAPSIYSAVCDDSGLHILLIFPRCVNSDVGVV